MSVFHGIILGNLRNKEKQKKDWILGYSDINDYVYPFNEQIFTNI